MRRPKGEIYVRVSVGIVEHPKMLRVPRAHRWAWIELLTYCKRNMTDGFVAESVAEHMLNDEELLSLRFSGLLDAVDGGYSIHDFLDWNPSREHIQTVRAEAGRKGGLRSGEVRRSNIEAKGKQKGSRREPETETETETKEGRTLARRAAERASVADEFDAFWNDYPRKVGKRTAARAYLAARDRASPDDILTGLRNLIPTWTDPQFIPHPTTWLNRDGWNDQPVIRGPAASLVSLADDARRLEEGRRFFA